MPRLSKERAAERRERRLAREREECGCSICRAQARGESGAREFAELVKRGLDGDPGVMLMTSFDAELFGEFVQ